MAMLRRYLRRPSAIVGAVLLLLILAVALAAPIAFPKDPLSLAGRPLQ